MFLIYCLFEIQDIYNDIQKNISKSENKVNEEQNHLNHVEMSSSPNNFVNVNPTQPDPIYDMVESIDSSTIHESTGAQPVIEISESEPEIPPHDASLQVWKVSCILNASLMYIM